MDIADESRPISCRIDRIAHYTNTAAKTMDIAKVFRHSSGKQVVVIRDEDPENGSPNISVLVEPEGLGICASKYGYPDTEAGWLKRDEMFEKFSEEDAISAAESILNFAQSATA